MFDYMEHWIIRSSQANYIQQNTPLCYSSVLKVNLIMIIICEQNKSQFLRNGLLFIISYFYFDALSSKVIFIYEFYTHFGHKIDVTNNNNRYELLLCLYKF